MGPFAKKIWLSPGTFAIRDQGPCHTLMEPVEPACSGHVFYKLQMDRKWIEMVCNLCTLLARFMFPVSLKREKKTLSDTSGCYRVPPHRSCACCHLDGPLAGGVFVFDQNLQALLV